jgi:hypothetical protein
MTALVLVLVLVPALVLVLVLVLGLVLVLVPAPVGGSSSTSASTSTSTSPSASTARVGNCLLDAFTGILAGNSCPWGIAICIYIHIYTLPVGVKLSSWFLKNRMAN